MYPHKFDAADLYFKERDDEFAAQIEIVEREEDVDSEVLANSVKIELAPSETKPYTR